MIRVLRRLSWLGVILGLVLPGPEASDAAEMEVVVDRLDQPHAVAVQSQTGRVVVAENGLGHIVTVAWDGNPEKAGDPEELLVGFPTVSTDSDPAHQVGPLSMEYFAEGWLLVGTGEGGPAGNSISLYSVLETGETPLAETPLAETPLGGKPLEADQFESRTHLPAEGETPGEGAFGALVQAGSHVYAVGRGDRSQGWICRTRLRDGQFSPLERFVATYPLTATASPRALTISPRGELVVGLMGEPDDSTDSVLAFFSASDGRMLMHLPLPLRNISALAYSPDHQLFAIDRSWSNDAEGGLYQIVSALRNGRQVAVVRQVVSLDRPTAMAFAKDGSLWVTTLGKPNPDDSRTGQLVRIVF